MKTEILSQIQCSEFDILKLAESHKNNETDRNLQTRVDLIIPQLSRIFLSTMQQKLP